MRVPWGICFVGLGPRREKTRSCGESEHWGGTATFRVLDPTRVDPYSLLRQTLRCDPRRRVRTFCGVRGDGSAWPGR